MLQTPRPVAGGTVTLDTRNQPQLPSLHNSSRYMRIFTQTQTDAQAAASLDRAGIPLVQPAQYALSQRHEDRGRDFHLPPNFTARYGEHPAGTQIVDGARVMSVEEAAGLQARVEKRATDARKLADGIKTTIAIILRSGDLSVRLPDGGSVQDIIAQESKRSGVNITVEEGDNRPDTNRKLSIMQSARQ